MVMPTDINDKKAKTISKYPLAVLVGIVCSLLTLFINKAFDSDEARFKYCQSESAIKDQTINDLRETLNKYTEFVLYQEYRVKNRDHVIDSLRKESNISNH